MHHDPRRLDWSLRELPRIAKNLRGAISALPASWEGKIVVEAAGAAETGVKSWWRGRKAQRTTVPLPRAGVELPVLGLGTCWLDEHESEASVGAALAWAAAHPAAPPVHVDSAEAYRNEAAVGRALAQFGPGRAFLASKLSDRAHLSYDGAKARVAETLRFFGVETVDLYSLHSAFNFLNDAKARADLAGAWRALVELQKKGTLRALGVSNFNAVELRAFAEDPALGGLWLPDVIQNKVDVYRRGEQEPGKDDVLAAAKELDIAVRRLRAPERLAAGVGARADPLLRQLAARRGVDVPTLILRWHVDAGHAAIRGRATRATSPRTRTRSPARASRGARRARRHRPSRTSSPARATGRRRRTPSGPRRGSAGLASAAGRGAALARRMAGTRHRVRPVYALTSSARACAASMSWKLSTDARDRARFSCGESGSSGAGAARFGRDAWRWQSESAFATSRGPCAGLGRSTSW